MLQRFHGLVPGFGGERFFALGARNMVCNAVQVCEKKTPFGALIPKGVQFFLTKRHFNATIEAGKEQFWLFCSKISRNTASCFVRTGRLFLYCKSQKGTHDQYKYIDHQYKYQCDIIHLTTPFLSFRSEGSKNSRRCYLPNRYYITFC